MHPTRCANRVLPDPPAPASVKKRPPLSRSRTCSISAWRPTKLVENIGRCVPGSLERSGGKDRSRSGCSNWYGCSTRSTASTRTTGSSRSVRPSGIESWVRRAVAADTNTCPPWARSRRPTERAMPDPSQVPRVDANHLRGVDPARSRTDSGAHVSDLKVELHGGGSGQRGARAGERRDRRGCVALIDRFHAAVRSNRFPDQRPVPVEDASPFGVLAMARCNVHLGGDEGHDDGRRLCHAQALRAVCLLGLCHALDHRAPRT